MTRLEQILTGLIPTCAPEHYRRLFFVSTVISLIAILLFSTLIISRHSYNSLKEGVITNSEKIADSIYCTEVDSLVITPGTTGINVTIPVSAFDALDARIRDLFGSFSVVTFAFYNQQGVQIYSTNKQQIGSINDQQAVLQSTGSRRPVYQHLKNQTVVDLYGETRRQCEIAKVIVPLKYDNERTAGAFVISSDITELIKNHHGKLHDTIIALVVAISIITFISSVIVIRAVVELKTAYNQVSHLAQTDPLTGIANRRSLFDQAEQIFSAQLSISQLERNGFGCIMLDIDHFKAVNDLHGHQAGDCLLKELAERVGAQLRPYDVFGRYGGEEFLIVLPNTRQENVQDIAHRLLTMIRVHQFDVNGKSLMITVSMGATWTDRGEHETLDTIIKRADELLYRAKNSGRDKIMFHVPPAEFSKGQAGE